MEQGAAEHLPGVALAQTGVRRCRWGDYERHPTPGMGVSSAMGERIPPLLWEVQNAMERRRTWWGGNRDVIYSITIADRLTAAMPVESRKCVGPQNADLVGFPAGAGPLVHLASTMAISSEERP